MSTASGDRGGQDHSAPEREVHHWSQVFRNREVTTSAWGDIAWPYGSDGDDQSMSSTGKIKSID